MSVLPSHLSPEDRRRLAVLIPDHKRQALRAAARHIRSWFGVAFVVGGLLAMAAALIALMDGKTPPPEFWLLGWVYVLGMGAVFGVLAASVGALLEGVFVVSGALKDASVLRERREILDAATTRGAVALVQSEAADLMVCETGTLRQAHLPEE